MHLKFLVFSRIEDIKVKVLMQQVYHPVQTTNSPMSNFDLTGTRFRQLGQQVTLQISREQKDNFTDR
jgi:hypothetical protein